MKLKKVNFCSRDDWSKADRCQLIGGGGTFDGVDNTRNSKYRPFRNLSIYELGSCIEGYLVMILNAIANNDSIASFSILFLLDFGVEFVGR